MDWARTLRIDASPSEAVRQRVLSAFSQDGVRVAFGPPSPVARTYALLQGPEGVDPSEFERRIPEAAWYGEAIIALAIEPTPPDALPALAHALGGPGAPAGTIACESDSGRLVVEFRPSATQPATLVRIADVELERFHGSRRTQLLTPLPVELVASIAAGGLQAQEIAPDRILEVLLERAHVE